MAKQVYKIDQFHGGINNNADPRDIKDHEFVELRDIMVDKVGQLRLMGTPSDESNVFSSDALTNSYGYGTFAFSHDYTMAGHHNILKNGTTNMNSSSFWTIDNVQQSGWTRNSTNFTFSSQGSGIIYQTAANRQEKGFNSKQYKFTYTVANYSESGGTPFFKIKGGSGEFANSDQNLNRSNGTHTKIFTSHSSASTGKFSIEAGNSTMNITLSALTLEPVAENTGDNYIMIYKGPGHQDTIHTFSYNNNNFAGQVNPSSDTTNFKFFRELDDTLYAQYYLIDGNIRFSDRNKGLQNQLRWYGYVGRKRFNNSFTISKWINAETRLIPPTSSNISLVANTSEYSPNAGVFKVGTQGLFTTVAGSGEWNKNGATGTATSGSGASKLVDTSASFTQSMVGMRIKRTNNTQETAYVGRVESSTVLYTTHRIGESSSTVITWSSSSTADTYRIYDVFSLGFSWMYDSNQESLIYKFSDEEPQVPNATLYFYHFRADNAWDTSVLARITGAEFYYKKESDDSNTWYHLFQIDLNKGLRISGEEDFTAWTSINSGAEYGLDISIKNPLTFETYETRNGFKNDSTLLFNMDNSDELGLGFFTGVVANRQFYIGNIKMADKDGVYKNNGDMMLKSLPNKFDTFPLDRKVEVSVQDGDEIIHLDTYADRLLQYKRNKLHIINISQEIEFLEDTYMYKGVKNPYAVCRTDYGIAWVNDLGCYLYDGKQVRNLIEVEGFSKINVNERDLDSSNGWFDYNNDNPSIGYIPLKRQLVITNDPKGEQNDNCCYLYDMVTKSWTFGFQKIVSDEEGIIAVPVSNFVNNHKGELVWFAGTTNSQLVQWSDSSNTSQNLIIKTKDIDFDVPSIRKRVYKVRISYKGDADSVVTQYSVNGDNNTFYNFEGTSSGKPTGSADTTPLEDKSSDNSLWHHAELKPATSSEANNIYSFQLHMSGTAPSSFKINDISIIYRIKTVK